MFLSRNVIFRSYWGGGWREGYHPHKSFFFFVCLLGGLSLRPNPSSPSFTPFFSFAQPQRPSSKGPPATPKPDQQVTRRGGKSFNDTDAILNEAVLQFTLNRTLTYYKCVIRRTIRFITRRVSFCSLMTMDAEGGNLFWIRGARSSFPGFPRGPIPAWPFVSPEGKILPFLFHQETGSACVLSTSLSFFFFLTRSVKEKTREKGDWG